MDFWCWTTTTTRRRTTNWMNTFPYSNNNSIKRLLREVQIAAVWAAWMAAKWDIRRRQAWRLWSLRRQDPRILTAAEWWWPSTCRTINCHLRRHIIPSIHIWPVTVSSIHTTSPITVLAQKMSWTTTCWTTTPQLYSNRHRPAPSLSLPVIKNVILSFLFYSPSRKNPQSSCLFWLFSWDHFLPVSFLRIKNARMKPTW